ncbi:TRIO and F-actin-binding protein-like [Osmerus mordax]|uniref:TRIO and F-actin-binding protein-like n=1 Tax=Osmerus mordax TaxID=8014 RepID=UPI0035101654
MSSRWDSMELKKGSVPVPVTQMDPEVIKKWAEFESLSFRDVSAQSLIGAQTSPSTTAQALQREALSLREQVEGLRRERVAMGTVVEVGVEEGVEVTVDSPCGPGAPCRARLKATEEAHRQSLRELQERHAREIRELERERDRLLQEESQATAQAVEALKKAHREELEREVDKARRLGGGVSNLESGQHSRKDSLHSELDVLSERYSQKCLELSRTEQSCGDRQTDLGRREREMEQLRRENQELKVRLAEEVSRMRYFITGQRSGSVSPGNCERSPSELEMELRAKDNEIQYLQKEISCLQSEVLSLTKEKETAYDRYKEAYVELSGMKGRSQLEMGSLREHLRLANAALQEGARDS